VLDVGRGLLGQHLVYAVKDEVVVDAFLVKAGGYQGGLLVGRHQDAHHPLRHARLIAHVERARLGFGRQVGHHWERLGALGRRARYAYLARGDRGDGDVVDIGDEVDLAGQAPDAGQGVRCIDGAVLDLGQNLDVERGRELSVLLEGVDDRAVFGQE